MIAIQIGNILKHMNLPKFDATNDAHLTLADTVREAYAAPDGDRRDELLERISELGDDVLSRVKYPD